MVGTVLALRIADIKRMSQVFGRFNGGDVLEVSQNLELKRNLCYITIIRLQSFHSISFSPANEAVNFLPLGHLALSSITVIRISSSGSPSIVTE